jgi:hypothetical protein
LNFKSLALSSSIICSKQIPHLLASSVSINHGRSWSCGGLDTRTLSVRVVVVVTM